MQYGTGSWDCETLGSHRIVARVAWPVERRLITDRAAIGIDPAAATITAPAIEGFQPAGSFTRTGPIPIDPKRGWVLVMESA